MPTNFQISSAPALRCVTGDPYAPPATDRTAGFFGRLRIAERLVIHSGPPHSIGPRVGEWHGRCAGLELHPGFRKGFFHA